MNTKHTPRRHTPDDLTRVMETWAAHEEFLTTEPPPLEDLRREARHRTAGLTATALALGAVAATTAWLSLAGVLSGTNLESGSAGTGGDDAAATTRPDDPPLNTVPDPRLVTRAHPEMDEIPLLARTTGGTSYIVMSDSKGQPLWTEIGYMGELVQETGTGCLMLKPARWPERSEYKPDLEGPPQYVVWPPGVTVVETTTGPRVDFPEGKSLELGDTTVAGGLIEADAVRANLDHESPCSGGDLPLRTLNRLQR